jgi:hypothetical protein
MREVNSSRGEDHHDRPDRPMHMTAPTVLCTSKLPTAHEAERPEPTSRSERVDSPGVARPDHSGNSLAVATTDS